MFSNEERREREAFADVYSVFLGMKSLSKKEAINILESRKKLRSQNPTDLEHWSVPYLNYLKKEFDSFYKKTQKTNIHDLHFLTNAVLDRSKVKSEDLTLKKREEAYFEEAKEVLKEIKKQHVTNCLAPSGWIGNH